MEKAQLLALHDQQQRIEIEDRTMRREVMPEVIRHVNCQAGEGMIMYSRLNADNADRVIQEQIDYFRAITQDFEWKTYDHDTPSDLKTRLLAHGFLAEEPEALLILDIESAPASLLQPVSQEIRHITDPSLLEAVEQIQASVWGESDPSYIAALRDAMVHDAGHQDIYLAYAEGTPVAYARITYHDRSQFAGLWGGSTLKDYRGQGFYTSLLAVRLQAAQRRGARFLTIDASAMSRPIVEKHGFRFMTMTQPFKWRTPK
jgi:GNAT superfamily N-acetyltransferase